MSSPEPLPEYLDPDPLSMDDGPWESHVRKLYEEPAEDPEPEEDGEDA